MVAWVPLLAIHILLLLLASTSFTILPGLTGEDFRWQYFQFSSQSGWGVPYQFPYQLSVVVAYLAAYGMGIAAYIAIWRRSMPLIGVVGVICCGLGFASFGYELTHWFRDSYNAWIVSLPGPLVILAMAALLRGWWRSGRTAGHSCVEGSTAIQRR